MQVVERTRRPIVDCANSGKAGESRTKQSEAKNCDINLALAKYRKNKIVSGPFLNTKGQPIFGDFTNAPDSYFQAKCAIAEAEQAFGDLPAKLRERFENSPEKLLEFLSNEDNREEAIKLGLLEQPVPEVVQKVEVINNEEPKVTEPEPSAEG